MERRKILMIFFNRKRKHNAEPKKPRKKDKTLF